jgi:hypothetical protein
VEFKRFVIPACEVHTEIFPAKLGNKAGVLGAAQFIFFSVKSSDTKN